MPVMVAAVVAERGFAAVLLHAADEHRAVFAADLGVHVDNGLHAGTSAAQAFRSSTASSSPLYVTASPIRVSWALTP